MTTDDAQKLKANDWVSVNVNDVAYVKLTPEGMLVLKQHYVNIHPSLPLPQPDKDGYYRYMLWDLMCIFGPEVFLGGDPMFEGGRIIVRGT